MVYVPGTATTDQKKQNRSLQALNATQTTNTTDIATNTTAIATNTANIATNTANIATNTTAIAAIGTPVTSVATGVGLTGGPITTTGTIALSISHITNSIASDVALNNTANYFDGPSVAQGTSGTWFVSGKVSVLDTTGAASFFAKLWDGTTVIDSAYVTTSAASFGSMISLSGVLASPAANLKISVRDTATATGKILANTSGNGKDSTITAIRIA